MKSYNRSTSFLLTLLLLFSSFPYTAFATTSTQLPTEIPYVITEDLTLVKSNSPYIMKNYVTIKPGATLRVKPGVEIIGNVKQLIVQGNLDIQGTKEELVVLEDVYIDGQSGGTTSINFADWRKTGIAALFNKNAIFSMTNSKFAYGSIHFSNMNFDTIISKNLFHNEATLDINGAGTGKVQIEDNTFYNYESKDIDFSCSNYDCANPNNIVIENNNFYNHHIHLYLTGDHNATLNIDLNFWDTTILAKIYGTIVDSMGLPNIEVTPIATTPFPMVFEFPVLETPTLEGNQAMEGTTYKGTAPNASKVVLKSKTTKGEVVWYETGVYKGKFTFYVPRQPKGTTLELFSYTSNRTSESKTYTVQPSFWNAKPIVYPVTPGSTIVEGLAVPETQVVVEKDNQIIGSGTSSNTGEFEIQIPQQNEHEMITVYSTYENQKTESTTVTVKQKQDQEPPVIQSVKLGYNQDSVEGLTEPNINIQVRVNHLFVGESTSDSNGRFTVTFIDTQVGDQVEVTAVDAEGNRSTPSILDVKDQTKPAISPTVFSNADRLYTGRSETDVTLYIYDRTSGNFITKGQSDEYGLYSISIPPQEAGTWLKIEAIDSSGNTAELQQKVVDYLSPTIEHVSSIYEGDTAIGGKTEPNATVDLFINEVASQQIKANNEGQYTFMVPALSEGDKIKIMATDQSRNSSAPYTVEVSKLLKISAPHVDLVSDQSRQVTGKTSPNKKVRIYKDAELIQEGVSSDTGDFNIEIPIQLSDTKLTVVSLNERNQEGDPTVLTVLDKTAPVAPIITSTVTDQTRKINGTAEPLSTVIIMQNERLLSEETVTEQGEFSAEIPLLEANSELQVYSVDEAGNRSLATIIKVKDATAPTVIINSITNLSTAVTGISNETGMVEVKKGTELIKKTSVEANKPFSITIPIQKEGVTLSIIAVDVAGNTSNPITTIVKDVIAPVAPKVNKVTNLAKEVTGTAEAGTIVRVFVGTKQLGYSTSNGSFKVVIPVQPAGVTLSVKSYDKSGNISKETNVKVLDVVAPGKPIFNPIKNNMTTVSGKAERGAIVRLYSGTKLIGYTTATSTGTFSMKIPVQKAGVRLSAIATDLSGNKSSTTYVTVLDGIAPSAPKVNAVYSKSYYVTGKTEAYSTLKVKRGSTVIGSVKADRYGNFKVKISRQKRGITLGITSTDVSRNESKPTSIKVR